MYLHMCIYIHTSKYCSSIYIQTITSPTHNFFKQAILNLFW